MSRRIASLVLPWLSVIASIVCWVATVLIEEESLADLGRPGVGLVGYLWPASWLGFQIVGAMLMSAGVRNRIAILLMGIGASVFLNGAAAAYARQSLVIDPGSLPFGSVAGWLGAWTLIPGLGLLPLLLLLFPTGRSFTRRWRPAAWFATGSLILLTAWQMVAPVEVAGGPANMPRFRNPVGLDQLAGAAEAVTGFLSFLLLLAGVLGAVSLVWRWRRGSATERQQLKVLVFAVALVPAVLVAGGLMQNALGYQAAEVAIVAAFVVGFNAISAAMGLSIVRYRLYDVDIVVNRTLVYGGLTALLAGAYFGFVVLFQGVVPGTEDSDLAVAASTLAVAALFGPARARVQGFIDRRFYRRKYDAQRTLETFTARLRDEIELDALSGDLVDTVRRTVQPSHASLWLRSEQ